LARALSRLFAAGSPWRQKLTEERCYLRYAVAPNVEDRRGAVTALKNWLNSQRETAAEIFEPTFTPAAETEAATEAERAVDRVSKAREYEKVFPAGF